MKLKILMSSYVIILYNLLGLITWYNHYYLLPSTLIFVFILSYLVFKSYRHQRHLTTGLLLVLPFVIINFFSCLYYSDFSRGLPYILFVPLSTYLSFLYFKNKKLVIPILSLAVFWIISFSIFPNFFVYYHNHNAEKNIFFTEIDLVNERNEKTLLDKSKIVVLDFWSTNCSICFKKFPDLEKTYYKYKQNENVQIVSVNVPVRNDNFDATINILRDIGYTFPKLYAKSFKQVETNLKFNTFPHLMIIKNGKIRYDGLLITSDESALFNIDDQIDKLLNEK